MAPGTRTPNARKPPNEYAGLPRDLNSRLAANTLARLKAVFCLPATTQTAPKHQTKKHRSKAFNAEVTGAAAKRREPKAHAFGVRLTDWLRAGYPLFCIGTQC